MRLLDLLRQSNLDWSQIRELLKHLPKILPFILPLLEVLNTLKKADGPVDEGDRVVFGNASNDELIGWVRDECPDACAKLSEVSLTEAEPEAFGGPVFDFVSEVVNFVVNNLDDLPKIIEHLENIKDEGAAIWDLIKE